MALKPRAFQASALAWPVGLMHRCSEHWAALVEACGKSML